jgi:methionyl-tRNA formyltransferase
MQYDAMSNESDNYCILTHAKCPWNGLAQLVGWAKRVNKQEGGLNWNLRPMKKIGNSVTTLEKNIPGGSLTLGTKYLVCKPP